MAKWKAQCLLYPNLSRELLSLHCMLLVTETDPGPIMRPVQGYDYQEVRIIGTILEAGCYNFISLMEETAAQGGQYQVTQLD